MHQVSIIHFYVMDMDQPHCKKKKNFDGPLNGPGIPKRWKLAEVIAFVAQCESLQNT